MTELPLGRFDGRQDFRRWLRKALAVAARDGWPELLLSDTDFADWPLGEQAVVASLQQWARPGRRLRMLAERYDEVVRRHARFVQWRVRFDHLVHCHAAPAERQRLPSLLGGPAWLLHRLDLLRCRGLASGDAAWCRARRESLEAAWRQSSPAFPATVLGL